VNRVTVESTNLAAVGYDADSSTLEIEFRNGSVYQYFDVPSFVVDDLISGESAGSYFYSNVRGVYRFARA